jgi:glycosyltransferase involved in cell wall biosynthesis
MACGRAVVTAGSGSIPEVVGDAAEVIPPGDSKVLRTVLKKLIVDKEARMNLGWLARARAVERYSHLKIARQITDVYRGLVGANQGRDPIRVRTA